MLTIASYSCRLELNRMADWTDEEYRQAMTPLSGLSRPRLQADGIHVRLHKPTMPAYMLPAAVDWRGTPADSPVKDQGMCGSCWVWSLPLIFHVHVTNPIGQDLISIQFSMCVVCVVLCVGFVVGPSTWRQGISVRLKTSQGRHCRPCISPVTCVRPLP